MKTYSFDSFMKGTHKTNYKKVATYTGIATIAILLVPSDVYASSSIDQGARVIYGKLLEVGKWIIIIKGALDTINNVVQGDFNTAKKSFFGYLVVYMVLQGLPWAMDEVDKVFHNI